MEYVMNRQAIRQLVDEIHSLCEHSRRIQLMEVCGTHTVSLFRSGVKSMLPANLQLRSGPGCPVCVTSQGYIEAACELADRPDVTICTYGDMVRVPGVRGSLAERRADGANVVVVYSPRDALKLARQSPKQNVVFLSVGFETTTPGSAATILEASGDDVRNFFILPSHKLVIPAMQALLAAGDVPIDGFLCPGHVSVVIGAGAYQPIVEQYKKPCVVAGFEAKNMLEGIARLCRQIVEGRACVENVYPAVVSEEGNTVARELVDRVFEPADEPWRAMGVIPASGLTPREAFRRFDAREALGVSPGPDVCPPGCRCGDVIQGKATPDQCALFGVGCSPEQPVGPCMVSSEGACAAWYKYGRGH